MKILPSIELEILSALEKYVSYWENFQWIDINYSMEPRKMCRGCHLQWIHTGSSYHQCQFTDEIKRVREFLQEQKILHQENLFL